MAGTRPAMTKSESFSSSWKEPENARRFLSQALRSQTIITSRDEINKSTIAQILELLTYLGFDVLIAGVEIAEMLLERINLFKREVALPKGLNAFHDIEQPAPRFRRFISEEKCFLPFRKDNFLRANDPVLYNMNFTGIRNAADHNIRADPARASRGSSQRFSFLNDLSNKKVLWHDEQVNDRK